MIGKIADNLLTVCSIYIFRIVQVINIGYGLVVIKNGLQLSIKAETKNIIKACSKMSTAISFSQQEKIMRRNISKCIDSLFPEIKRWSVCIIKPKPIYIGSINPVLHSPDHFQSH